jgi:hypothetical protein
MPADLDAQVRRLVEVLLSSSDFDGLPALIEEMRSRS